MNMNKFYAIKLEADYICFDSSKFINVSHKAFKSKEECEAYVPIFIDYIKKKTEKTILLDIDKPTIKTSILDFEIDD